MRWFLASLIVMAGILGTGPTRAETVIGRWCDVWTPSMKNVLAIVITNDGNAVLRINLFDGTSDEYQLNETSEGFYVEVDSGHGDKYRIVPSTGELQLLDNDGLIRVANRLENTVQPSECGK